MQTATSTSQPPKEFFKEDKRMAGMATVIVIDEKIGLKKGERYNVKQVTLKDKVTSVILDGIDGVFQADCFKEVPKTYLGNSTSIPVEGEYLNGYYLTENGEWSIIESTRINKVKLIYQNIYSVKTEKAIYLLQVIS